jgi:dihydrofolate reductase
MRKIIQSINITVNGSCHHTAVIAGDELHNSANELLRNADTILFGRITYQLFENAWPAIAKRRIDTPSVVEFASLINNVDKMVFSKTLDQVQWSNSTLRRDLNVEEILALKQGPGKNIIAGSLSIAAQLARNGLIDEYHFLVHPLITGKVNPFLEKEEDIKPLFLKLRDTRIFKSGVTYLCYTV